MARVDALPLAKEPAEARVGLGPIALATVGAGSIAWYLVTSLQRIGYPYELTYFEGSTVEVTGRVLAGEPLYGPPTMEFTPWPYPPLYFWLTAAVAKVVGLQLPTLRLLSVVASLAALVLLGAIVRRAGGSRPAALVAAGLFAATFRVSGAFADTGRVDSLLVALLLVAVLVGMRARTWRGGLLLGVVLVLGFLTKQNALVVAAPILAWLLVRRRRVGIAATATLGVGVVGSTVVGNLLTDGWYARYVIEQLPSQAWALDWLWGFWWTDLVLPFSICLVVAAGLSVTTVWWRRRGDSDHRPRIGDDRAYLLAAAAGLVLASWVARVHEGGYSNVAMPAQAAAAGAVGLVLAGWLQAGHAAGYRGMALSLLLVAQVLVMAAWNPNIVPSAEDRAAGDRFIATLRELPGDVLVPTHPYYLRLAGRPTHASSIAIDDLLRSRDGAERLAAVVPWSLEGVSAVVLDNATDVRLFGPELTREFTLVTSSVVPDGVFLPPTDLPTHPALLYVRASELGR